MSGAPLKESGEFVKFTKSGKLVNHGGSGNAYANHGCRCLECREANRKRVARRQAERNPDDAPEDSHGKTSTYTNWNCRCELCTQAHNEHCKKVYRARKKRERAQKGAGK